MSYEQFLEILIEIEPLIARKQIQGGHKIISPAERLTLTIRFLATGESFTSLHFQFRIGEATISYIVHEVCKAIYQHLGRKYLSTPRDERKWREIATEFYARWQFPNCVGAIDGKHLVMQPPTGSGSHYVNYKHTHSVVLMAIAGPDYQCIYADVGKGGAGKGAKDLHRLAFCVQTTHKLSQVEKNLRCNLNMLKFVASHRKSSQVGGQTRHKHAQAKTCDDLRSRLIRALSKTKQGRLVDTATNLPRSGRNKTTWGCDQNKPRKITVVLRNNLTKIAVRTRSNGVPLTFQTAFGTRFERHGERVSMHASNSVRKLGITRIISGVFRMLASLLNFEFDVTSKQIWESFLCMQGIESFRYGLLE